MDDHGRRKGEKRRGERKGRDWGGRGKEIMGETGRERQLNDQRGRQGERGMGRDG